MVRKNMDRQILLINDMAGYGKFDILETADYMRNTVRVWKELGFSFDAVSTGFIVSNVQAEMIADFCSSRAVGSVGFPWRKRPEHFARVPMVWA